jgi:hypothetical protein
MKFESTRIIAMLLLLVTFIGFAMSLGENVACAGDAPGTHDASHSSFAHEGRNPDDHDRSGTSSSSHSPNDHFCFGVCDGACHAPLASTPLIFTYSPVFTCLCSPEITPYIPEVFLSLFVPPDVSIV